MRQVLAPGNGTLTAGGAFQVQSDRQLPRAVGLGSAPGTVRRSAPPWRLRPSAEEAFPPLGSHTGRPAHAREMAAANSGTSQASQTGTEPGLPSQGASRAKLSIISKRLLRTASHHQARPKVSNTKTARPLLACVAQQSPYVGHSFEDCLFYRRLWHVIAYRYARSLQLEYSRTSPTFCGLL